MPRLTAAPGEIAVIVAATFAFIDAKDTLKLGRGLKEPFEKICGLSIAPKVFESASSEVGAASGCSSGNWFWIVKQMLTFGAFVTLNLSGLCLHAEQLLVDAFFFKIYNCFLKYF